MEEKWKKECQRARFAFPRRREFSVQTIASYGQRDHVALCGADTEEEARQLVGIHAEVAQEMMDQAPGAIDGRAAYRIWKLVDEIDPFEILAEAKR